jgi:mono/diheme cytochrome c family protein
MRVVMLCLCALSGSFAAAPKNQTDGSLVARHCARCHGADGGGKGLKGERLPGGKISDPKRLIVKDEAALLTLILEGRKAMPGFKAKLGPEEARKLAKQILKGWPKTR